MTDQPSASIALTPEDMEDLVTGHTINAMAEDGSEITLALNKGEGWTLLGGGSIEREEFSAQRGEDVSYVITARGARGREGVTTMERDNGQKSYAEALVVFRDLLDDCDIELANEYVRGGVNLIADLFGIVERPVDERMDDVLADLRRIPMFADPNDLGQYGVKPYVHNPTNRDREDA